MLKLHKVRGIAALYGWSVLRRIFGPRRDEARGD
jgi:hypothetical protein